MNRRIPQHEIAQIAAATNLVELVAERVDLVERGRRFVGLCPFHAEKTPSFSVNPEWGIYKCFGCGRSGGAYQFVMEMDGLSFPEAVAELGRRAGIATEGLAARDDHDELRRVVAWAAEQFRAALLGPTGDVARHYLRERGFTDEILERFGVGYAPEGWDRLIMRARRDGIAPAQLLAAGLAKQRQGSESLYDAFRDRVIFPISDARGRVIAFGGRVMPGAPDDAPKYINSPESPLYKKSQVLYGHAQGRDAIRRAGRVIIAEGYTDVIMAHQHGVCEVVACCGTSITEEHAHTLARVARDQVLFVFDGDGAGVAAAERGLELLLPLGRRVGVVVLPGGADPADLLLESGGPAFTAEVERARDPFSFKLDQLSKRLDLSRPADKAKATDELLALLARLPNPVERDLQAGELAQKLGVDPRALAERRRQKAPAPRAMAAPHRPDPPLPPEALLVGVLFHRPDLATLVADRYPLGRYRDAGVRRIVLAIDRARESAPALRLDAIVAVLEEPGDAGLLIEAVHRVEQPDELDRPLSDFIARADRRDRDERAKHLKAELAQAELARDEVRKRQITQEYDSLMGAHSA